MPDTSLSNRGQKIEENFRKDVVDSLCPCIAVYLPELSVGTQPNIAFFSAPPKTDTVASLDKMQYICTVPVFPHFILFS
jgi:hypothetical protein